MILSSPETSGRSTARKATRKYRLGLNSAMFCLTVSWNAIRFVLLGRPFASKNSSNKRHFCYHTIRAGFCFNCDGTVLIYSIILKCRELLSGNKITHSFERTGKGLPFPICFALYQHISALIRSHRYFRFCLRFERRSVTM